MLFAQLQMIMPLTYKNFFIFSITAFGGLDTIASLADKTKKSRSRFPRAVIIRMKKGSCESRRLDDS
jgi:amino acid transporter